MSTSQQNEKKYLRVHWQKNSTASLKIAQTCLHRLRGFPTMTTGRIDQSRERVPKKWQFFMTFAIEGRGGVFAAFSLFGEPRPLLTDHPNKFGTTPFGKNQPLQRKTYKNKTKDITKAVKLI